MLGNVWEWCETGSADDPTKLSELDFASIESMETAARVVRGGAWHSVSREVSSMQPGDGTLTR